VVETILREAEGADAGGEITGEATALRALAAAYQGDAPRAVQLARQALELLPEDNLLLRGFAIGSLGLSYLWAEDLDAAVRTFEEGARIGEKVGNVMFAVIALRRVGRLRMAQGRLHEAKAVFDRALELAVDCRGRRLPIAGLVLTGLGYLAREWNDLETAARYLTEGIELAQGTSAAMTVGAHLALARVRQAQGDPAGAREILHKAAQLAARTEATGLDDLGVAMNQAMLCLDQGDLGPAIAWARSRGLDQPVDALVQQAGEESAGGLIRRYEIPALAKLLLAQQRPRDALALLDLILPRIEREGRFEIVIQIEALRALAFQAAGHPVQAFKTLERALTLAEPSGYIRLFVDEGEPLRLLISDFRLMIERRTRGESQKLIEYTNKLLAAFPQLAPVAPPQSEINNLQSAMVEPLSEREREVLRLLAADLSNPEIAERLCLTVNTVRSHVKSIYGKLNVHSRYEATLKAQELRLL
jgi:LuxR family maltose regulon positive regulatory protein